MEKLVWLGIVLCLSQSATLSGANLAYFSISKMRLELEGKRGNPQAKKVLDLRKDANFLLVTILWANVSINVLLALLAESALTGILAFLFSTVFITILGEILPQAYFSRRALSMAALLAPLIRIYQVLLYPVARPTAWVLDRWLGEEAVEYFKERDLEELIAMHVEAVDTEIEEVEGIGAMNFLAMDEIPLALEGESLDPRSVVKMDFQEGRPVFPSLNSGEGRAFLEEVGASGHKWVVLADRVERPQLMLDADHLLREALLHPDIAAPMKACHRPILVTEGHVSLGEVLPRFKVQAQRQGDDVIDEDVVLLWGEERRIITGSDILGRLLRGIVENERIFLGLRTEAPERTRRKSGR